MRVGVKFCGGCNPRYDRSGELDKILSHFEKDSDAFAADHAEKGKALFGFAKEGGAYDVLLVICGCNNQCASTDDYTFGKKISIGETGNIPMVVRLITEYRDEEAQGA
ncbi:MAG: hypothetical protein LBL36_05910 [Clostridiales Family XIII bacterium]|nr:hypothetical protein [Clostridiales Family XIII bacterium]